MKMKSIWPDPMEQVSRGPCAATERLGTRKLLYTKLSYTTNIPSSRPAGLDRLYECVALRHRAKMCCHDLIDDRELNPRSRSQASRHRRLLDPRQDHVTATM